MRWVRRVLAERLSPELRREATEDPLTGALNRRADRAATARALADRRPGTRVVRLVADLDNFKALNDACGHHVGDVALCVVRGALEHATRDVDLVSLARPGGDEFALTLRVAADADVTAIRDRLEEAVGAALAQAGLRQAGGKEIGLSAGVAEVTGPVTPEALDAAADRAARARKRARGVSQARAAAPRGQRRRKFRAA
ncbi:MAG TPA: GGDEF domain-containing protein [Gemmatimonadales bacterium]|nr:GGDEF domain-containing protein [Gemmatimonadales bacterium]